MSRVSIRIWLLAAALLPAARADFGLFVIDGTGEHAAPPLYSIGTVFADDAAPVRFRLRNLAAAPALLSYLEVRGVGFGPKNPLALPLTLEAEAMVDFTVVFSAPDPGAYSAALVGEGVSLILTVKVVDAPPSPAPRIVIDLPRAESGQQGSTRVKFDAPAFRGGSGAVTLDFQPASAGAADGAIAFSTGTTTAAFTFAPGDTECRFANPANPAGALFQTGTTAGVLTFTARIGAASSQTTVVIAPAPVSVSGVQGARFAGSLEVRLTGFDNTRTAGALEFTFFDAAGNAIAPGTIHADATAAFRQLFETSDLGGAFLLRAVFPLTGDASRIAAFEAVIGNSQGAAIAARASF